MSSKAKPSARKAASVRQSVTLPAQVAVEVCRVAKARGLTRSRALVELAQRGIEAEAEARANLDATYRRFISESNPKRKDKAGKDLIRAIFGTDAIAEDSLR